MQVKFSKPLVRGSFTVLAGSLGGSFLNYLFHLVMGRVLVPAEYGVLVSLFSLLYIVGVPGGVLGTTAAKFASQYKARGDFKAVTAALIWTSKAVVVLGLTFLGLAFVFRNQLAEFLKVANPLLPVLFFGFIALSLLASILLGFLQGLLRFKAFSLMSFLGPLLKVLFGVGLAALGFGIWGVAWGLIISSGLAIAISLLLLKKNLRHPLAGSSFVKTDLLKYALPTTVTLLALTAFYNADVILVKHFFSPEEAGIYSSVVMTGRIIFFGLSSVVLVAFPMAAEKQESGGNPFLILRRSLLLVVPGAVVGVLAYLLLPRFLVALLFGSQYLAAVPYLGVFAVFIGLYAVVDLIFRFFLSIGSFRPAIFLVIFSVLQVLLLGFFHETLIQVIYVNIAVMIGALATLGIDYAFGNYSLLQRREKN